MRHLKAGRKLGRNSSHRKALYRNMLTALMENGRIRTTDAKARELRPLADKVITLGKRVPPSKLLGLTEEELVVAKAQRVHAIRQARRLLTTRAAIEAVFNEYAERYQGRPGGYTRILKLSNRPGDNAPMALLELVSALETPSDEPAQQDDAAPAAEEAQEAAAAEDASQAG